jgi:hypothetical protein
VFCALFAQNPGLAAKVRRKAWRQGLVEFYFTNYQNPFIIF